MGSASKMPHLPLNRAQEKGLEAIRLTLKHPILCRLETTNKVTLVRYTPRDNDSFVLDEGE